MWPGADERAASAGGHRLDDRRIGRDGLPSYCAGTADPVLAAQFPVTGSCWAQIWRGANSWIRATFLVRRSKTTSTRPNDWPRENGWMMAMPST